MTTQEEIYQLLTQIQDDLIALPGKIKLAPNQVKIVTGLSELSENLGTLLAGEFRSGNGIEPEFGFSGMRMAYPPMLYETELWNLVGVENDVLQFGVRASDGKAIAGAGAVTLDVNGVTLDITQNEQVDPASVKFKNTITNDIIATISAYDILGSTIFHLDINTQPLGDHAGAWINMVAGSQYADASATLSAVSLPSPTEGGVGQNAKIDLHADSFLNYTAVAITGTTVIDGGLFIGSPAGYAFWSDPMPDSGVLWMSEQASSTAPPTGYGSIYVKTDGSIYFKNDSGIEYRLNIGSVTATQFLYNDASTDIAGYKQLLVNHSAAAKETLTFAGVTDGQTLEEFATEPNSPGTHFLYAGLYSVHIHALKSAGTKDAQIKANIYKRTSGGTETLLGTTQISPELTGAEVEYEMPLALGDINLDLTDRLVVKIIGVVTGLGTDPTVSLYVEGDTYAHFSFPALTQGGTSNVNKQIVTTDALIGSGLVVGNAAETNNPGPGEIWLQNQTAIPSGTTSVFKLLDVNNQLVRVNEGGQAFRVVDDGSWMQIAGTLTRYSTHTNLFPNPTFEVDTYSWGINGIGSSAARQAGGAWGSYCMRFVMAGAGTTHMAYTAAGIPAVVNGTQYRIGFYARSISGDTSLRSELWGGVGGTSFTLTANWQYFSYLATGSTNQQFFFWLNGGAGTFEIDGMSCIQTTADPPYSDPTFGQGQVWSGTAHSSVSYRTCEVATVAGNITDRLSLGQKFLCLDGGSWKNFYLICFWYDPYRLFTVMMLYGGASYVLTSNPTALYYGTTNVPVGFTDWMTWSPQFTGFSANPTGGHLFCLIGRTCLVNILEASGTSNATGFTLTMPLAAAYNSYHVIRAIDNNVALVGLAILGGLTTTLYSGVNGASWTASGTKYAQFTAQFQWA